MYKIFTIMMATMVFALIGCGVAPKGNDLQRSNDIQQEVIGRAFDSVPPYQPNDFAARKAINWYLQETESFDTWYVYAVNRDGVPMFYVVSDFKPQNICVSITAPDRLHDDYDWGAVISSPALDGVYYSGNSSCNAYYMRDSTTGGFIEIAGDTFTLISSKTPLYLETDLERIEP